MLCALHVTKDTNLLQIAVSSKSSTALYVAYTQLLATQTHTTYKSNRQTSTNSEHSEHLEHLEQAGSLKERVSGVPAKMQTEGSVRYDGALLRMVHPKVRGVEICLEHWNDRFLMVYL